MTHYYRLCLEGYGGDSAYIKLNKEAYDYWTKRQKESDDDPLLDYVLESEDVYAFSTVPESADFLLPTDKWDDADERNRWQECKSIIARQQGIDYRSCNLTVEEVPGNLNEVTYSIPIVKSILLQDYAQDFPTMLNKTVLEDTESHYMLQVYSSEKGVFFDSIFSSLTKFKPNKLHFNIKEYFNGDYIVESIVYDNEVLKSNPPNILTRGVSVSTWKSR